MFTERVTRGGRGQGRGSGAGRAVPPLAHAPFRPPLAAGEEAWTWTQPSLLTERVQAEASQSYQSVHRRSGFGQLLAEGTAGRISGGFSGLELFGTLNGAGRGTLDAMSRRKLGSRPQHLSAIQGKSSGRCVCGGGGGARWSWTCVCSSGKSEINSGHSFCFIVSLRAWFWCALAPITQ